jgi:hypothetical protein
VVVVVGAGGCDVGTGLIYGLVEGLKRRLRSVGYWYARISYY